jgi:hypothetical protein
MPAGDDAQSARARRPLTGCVSFVARDCPTIRGRIRHGPLARARTNTPGRRRTLVPWQMAALLLFGFVQGQAVPQVGSEREQSQRINPSPRLLQVTSPRMEPGGVAVGLSEDTAIADDGPRGEP